MGLLGVTILDENGIAKAASASPGADKITVDTANLDKLLSGVTAEVQSMLEAIDELVFSDFASIALIYDQKAYNSDGGDFNTGAWRTRDLNTEFYDPAGIVSLGSNQFTLGAGNYLILWVCPNYGDLDRAPSRLYNATDATAEHYTMTGYDFVHPTGFAIITPAGTKAYEIQQRSEKTVATSGFGRSQGIDSSGYSVFTQVLIIKFS